MVLRACERDQKVKFRLCKRIVKRRRLSRRCAHAAVFALLTSAPLTSICPTRAPAPVLVPLRLLLFERYARCIGSVLGRAGGGTRGGGRKKGWRVHGLQVAHVRFPAQTQTHTSGDEHEQQRERTHLRAFMSPSSTSASVLRISHSRPWRSMKAGIWLVSDTSPVVKANFQGSFSAQTNFVI